MDLLIIEARCLRSPIIETPHGMPERVINRTEAGQNSKHAILLLRKVSCLPCSFGRSVEILSCAKLKLNKLNGVS